MREEKVYFVYILASRPHGTLYGGVTNWLHKRVIEHHEGTASKFTKKYQVTKLMWFEVHDDIEVAIQREKSLKRWPRAWKINLIERANPDCHDLYPSFANYEPKGPLSEPDWTMGPRDCAVGLTPDSLPEDDSRE